RREHKLGLLSAVLISLCVVFFMGISGWTPSVVRSGVMCLLGIAAALFHAEYDSRSALGFAMLVLCALQPLAGGGIGLCLSFLSVLGILQLGPWFGRWAARAAVHAGRCRSAVYAVLQGAGTSMAAVLWTLPLQALFLGGVSLLAPLVSIVLIPLATALLVFGLPAALVGCVPWLAPLARLLALPCGWCARLMSAVASFCGEYLDWSYLPARAWMLPAVLGILGLVMFCLFIGAKRRARIACAVMSLVIAFTAWVSWQLQTGSAVRFAVCGEESVLLFSGHTACVLQLGEEDAVPVSRALEENGVKTLRLVVLSRGDEALRDAAAQVMREFTAETLLLPEDVRPDEKLLLLTETPVIPYDNSSEIRLQYEKLTLRFCSDWAAAFPGGTAVPVPGGVRLQTTAGEMDLLFNENKLSLNVPAVLPEEDGIVYIDCLPDGQMQARRSDGWPK
ncbi:MAG: ComEC/Rec2 family competence protein, partial [Clostridia bacterium]|nr:ComEC/Rec2 family competence protein [Clostridia bacterium]